MRFRHVGRSNRDGDEGAETKLGPNVIAGVKELRQNVTWSQATVMRNESSTFDGSIRLIQLSVADKADILYGRKVKGVMGSSKWIESYTMPGQVIGLRFSDSTSTEEPHISTKLYSLAGSPYEGRRDSAYFDASIIEIVADRNGCVDDKRLCELGPGSQLEVSQVVGRGFSSLFSSASSVPAAVEEGRPMLLLAIGTKGLVPMRALLNWTPIQAHATKRKVACLYMTRTATTAAFLPGWDLWREAGVNFIPLYTEMFDPESSTHQSDVLDLLEKTLFLREGGFSSLVGPPPAITVLISGAAGEVAAQLAKKLATKGVEHERMLFCDYF
ncbi:hypothetical protein CEUSTIGMA_g11744.t1 [Chlamydomonas eustigma]|uniref:FAD-binding FR-type domain-containing protein n=1 Tax=Chlamydomonas eustigma TaxID=1157962 RepID=A0A250XN34_9CHLO|nr:hypothetical protein CEUSTIGMA_g11744.t1 [Chlamydomonas eustigma]|eukprot:GAX84322.1 hypothetical protein CEUSTIGMA_g11744.t1 [Chlamydomonas eustigma]